jgi:hypothetical protein
MSLRPLTQGDRELVAQHEVSRRRESH